MAMFFSTYTVQENYPTEESSTFLLVNQITVSHSHPSFDEADYTFIQEGECGFQH